MSGVIASLVGPVVSCTAIKLSDYLRKRYSQLHGLRDEIQLVAKELQKILVFLDDSKSRSGKEDEKVEELMRQLKDLAYETEDVIDSLALYTAEQASSLKFLLNPKSIISRLKMAEDIRKRRHRFHEIFESMNEIFKDSNLSGQANQAESRFQSSNSLHGRFEAQKLSDSKVIGLDADEEMVLRLLSSSVERRSVISIVGMGGIGKTTLARRVYNNKVVRKEFGVRAWVSVSKDYTARELLKKILKVATGIEEEGKLNEKVLYDKLTSRGRYLIVMDDVWSHDVWEQIDKALPDIGNRSRVIFTTRNRDVARFADRTITPYELHRLDEEASEQLFCMKVYENRDARKIPVDLRDVGLELIRNQCRGVPLAIKMLGGLLSMKEKNTEQWKEVLKELDSQPADYEYLNVLRVAYNDLYSNLKLCFLYLCSFPEGDPIKTGNLMRLWIAEDFIPDIEGKRTEDTAELFLDELIQRSLVHVVDRRNDGKAKAIQILGILRDLCISLTKEAGLLHVICSENSVSALDMTSIRRLALYKEIDPSAGTLNVPNLRTLLCFNLSSGESLTEPFHVSKLLRVIDVNVSNKDIPKEISNMIHLTYFRWNSRSSRSEVSSSSLQKLHNLQTLKVPRIVVDSDGSICNLENIHVLATLEAGLWMDSDLEKLKELRKLAICNIKDSHGKMLCNALKKLGCLASVSLQASESIPTSEVIESFSSHQLLRAIKLVGKLSHKQFPAKSIFPPSLSKLTLSGSQLVEDPMEMLEKLDNLVDLRLVNCAYKGMGMVCSAGKFPRLERLTIDHLQFLERWKIDDAAMPRLTHLCIKHCEKLESLPQGLQGLTTLQELTLHAMPEVLVEATKQGGADWDKVEHIPDIVISGA